MSSEWCGPTAEVPNQSLARLLSRARRTSCAPAQKRPSDSSVPLTDPWFEDSQPVPVPEVPAKPVEVPRERRERTSIPKLVTRAPVYPVYRGGGSRVVLWIGGIAAVIAATAALVIV